MTTQSSAGGASTQTETSSSERRSHSVPEIVGVVLLYWTVSISMVFANKYLVGSRFSNTDLSLFVAWAQCLSTVLVVVLLTLVRRYVFGQEDSVLPPLSRKVTANKDFFLLSMIFTAMLSFNNLTLKHVGVAFFQVARSMTLIFTVALSALLLKIFASYRVVFCCLVVAAGFILGVDQEKLAGTLSTRGVFYGLLTSVCVALNGIYTKRLLDAVGNSSVAVTYYMNLGATCFFLPLVIFSGQMTEAVMSKRSDPWFFMLLAGSGALGFMINLASNMQIDFTSPITHHISNNSKSVIQTVLAVIVYHEFKSALWWCSNALVICGAFGYTYVKMREERARKEAAAAPITEEQPKVEPNA